MLIDHRISDLDAAIPAHIDQARATEGAARLGHRTRGHERHIGFDPKTQESFVLAVQITQGHDSVALGLQISQFLTQATVLADGKKVVVDMIADLAQPTDRCGKDAPDRRGPGFESLADRLVSGLIGLAAIAQQKECRQGNGDQQGSPRRPAERHPQIFERRLAKRHRATPDRFEPSGLT